MIYINITNSYTTKVHTGIQRVVKELSSRLIKQDGFALIFYQNDFFHRITTNEQISRYLTAQDIDSAEIFPLSDLQAGDFFFDIDASWGDPHDFNILYRKIKNLGAIIVKMHYDAVPILYPELCHANTVYRYFENFCSAIQYADYWVCISKTVERDLHKLAEDLPYGKPHTFVIDLGADINTEYQSELLVSEQCKKLSEEKFIICVGTIEPRKNHALILDTYDELCQFQRELTPHLVIVGKPGWNNTDIIERIEQHPLYQKKIHWLDKANDKELELLYKQATLCLCLSHYEGYGLPVIEALARGTPVICTAESAMAEASQGFAIETTLDIESTIGAIKKITTSKATIPTLKFPSWNDSSKQMIELFQQWQSNIDHQDSVSQAVYISIRPEAIARSILSVCKNASFIRKALILTSDAASQEIKAAVSSAPIEITIINESELGLTSLPSDHQERNTLLRRLLYKSPLVEENFIAFDDDYIIIKEISISEFIFDKKHIGRFFQAGRTPWLGAHTKPTSFDIGIWKTIRFLEESGYDSKLYNAHQPQIINKKLANQILDRTTGIGTDEWSVYYNIAKHLKPHSFLDREYQSAGWPPDNQSWLPTNPPKETLYINNYTDEIGENEYQSFADKWLTQILDAIKAQKKIIPKIPSLFIKRDKAFFDEDLIICPQPLVLCIPILSTESIQSLRYEVGSIANIHHTNEIPNFLHIPLTTASPHQKLTLSISANINSLDTPISTSIDIVIRESRS